MLKAILIVVVLLGFAWGYPPTRSHIVYRLEPALVMLGPVGRWIIRPVQRYSTKQELDFILDQIVLARTEGKEIPDAKSFHVWLSKRVLTKNQGKDAWGNRYFLIRPRSGSLTAGSIGPDGKSGTEDDIRLTIPF
ncbi:MAG: type II secretion system protein GspG [Longimicrobiales bacterium]